ncbi:unnamed protein product [Lathyrus oleraceus]
MIQRLATSCSDSFLLGDNYPSWLAYRGDGPSVQFQVPEDTACGTKGITLCVPYSSTPENLATECFTSVLVINYTKFTIRIYKGDTVMSFNDEDWQSVVSNLGAGNNVEIFVAIGQGWIVRKTAVYLIYDQSNALETEPSSEAEIEPLHEGKVQPSPNVKTEPFAEEEVRPPPDVKMEPSRVVKNEQLQKKNRNYFTRLIKRVTEYLCLIQN